MILWSTFTAGLRWQSRAVYTQYVYHEVVFYTLHTWPCDLDLFLNPSSKFEDPYFPGQLKLCYKFNKEYIWYITRATFFFVKLTWITYIQWYNYNQSYRYLIFVQCTCSFNTNNAQRYICHSHLATVNCYVSLFNAFVLWYLHHDIWHIMWDIQTWINTEWDQWVFIASWQIGNAWSCVQCDKSYSETTLRVWSL